MRTTPTLIPARPARCGGVAAFGLLLAVGLTGCGASDSAGPTTSTTAPDTGAPSTSPTSPPTTVNPGATTVTVYFAGDTPDGPRLFSERGRVTDGDVLVGAAGVLTSGEPVDPDYRSLLSGAMDVTGARVSHATIVVTVGPGAQLDRDQSMTTSEAELAVQQLVYTMQAASGTKDEVRVVQRSGTTSTPVALLGVQATKTGVAAAEPASVLAPVNVTSPQQGDEVPATQTSLRVTGLASSFEANVPWDLHRGGVAGPVVRSGSATASGSASTGPLSPWKTTVALKGLRAGAYTIIARTDDPSGKGTSVTQDTKTFDIS